MAWQVLVSVVLTTAAATFDQPARQALIPALVPREQLPQAFALINPSREVAVLAGPALAGVLIGIGGPGLMYAVDAVTYAVAGRDPAAAAGREARRRGHRDVGVAPAGRRRANSSVAAGSSGC